MSEMCMEVGKEPPQCYLQILLKDDPLYLLSTNYFDVVVGVLKCLSYVLELMTIMYLETQFL